MSSKKSLGLFGFLGLLCLLLGAVVVGGYAARAYDLIDSIPWAGKDEGRLKLIVNAALGLPGAAVVFGFLGMKFADSGGAKAKCLGVSIGGLVLLGAMFATILKGNG